MYKRQRVLELKGQLTGAHEAMADYYFARDETRDAIGQLEQALKAADEDSNDSFRVAARIQAVKDALARLRERK